MVTLAFSRSWGIRTTESIPARAAWAATELARLPVEAQAATLKPSWRALVSATETTRSLKDPVGLAVSSLIPSSPARRSARTSGVKPAPRSTGVANSWWDPSSLPSWLNEECYVQNIQQRLRTIKVREISETMHVSKPYAAQVRAGRRRPHPRHWQSLAQLAGVTDQIGRASCRGRGEI